jgi:transcriptional regulator with XRE-family HTH domain
MDSHIFLPRDRRRYERVTLMVVAALPRQSQPRPYRELGRELRRAREAARWTQEELADRANISQAYVTKLENGYGRPTPEALRVLADKLGSDYESLAILAGFQRPQAEGETIQAPEDVAPYIRRLLHYPADVWAALEQTAGAWVTRRPKPETEDEAGDDSESHRSE